ncbi:hypothetical protein [Streptomyces sp. NPDC051211]|uniref:hypothetical protein n=1 Tax=Streptomyces sp. NPDC051211 TaxID=3154643 RepID=UPI00344BF95F
MTAGEFCVYCDEPVAATAENRMVSHSASGARPDFYAHPGCSPSSRPDTETVSPADIGEAVPLTKVWHEDLVAAVDVVLAAVEPPPEEEAAQQLSCLDYYGGVVYFYVVGSFDERGRRTEAAENALANWKAATALNPADAATGPWGKTVSLARVIRDLLAAAEVHRARLRRWEEEERQGLRPPFPPPPGGWGS